MDDRTRKESNEETTNVMTRISRQQIEESLRSWEPKAESDVRTAKTAGLSVAGVLAAGTAAFAYLVGRRRGKKRKTFVEVTRVE